VNLIGGICLKHPVSGREVGSSHHAVLIERGHSKEPLGFVDCHGVTITWPLGNVLEAARISARN